MVKYIKSVPYSHNFVHSMCKADLIMRIKMKLSHVTPHSNICAVIVENFLYT